MSTTHLEPLVALSDAAEFLGVTTGRIRQLITKDNSVIGAIKVGPIWVIPKENLKAFKRIKRPNGRPRSESKEK